MAAISSARSPRAIREPAHPAAARSSPRIELCLGPAAASLLVGDASRVKSWHRRETKTAGGLGLGQGKLVRDKIPQIIRSKGLQPITYVADVDEYGVRLRDKLAEEVDEFIASDDDPEELADILEVLYALAEHAGTSPQQLERLRAAKAEERGAFTGRIIWCGNRP